MIDSFAIFGAKYLYIFVVALAGIYFLKQPRAKQKELVLFGLVALPLMFLILKVAALFYYDARPFVVGDFTPLIPHEPDNGFPSDHAMLCSAIASLIFPFNKKMSGLLWVLTFLVAASRVYTGIHHSIDVLASMVIAVLVAGSVYVGLKHFKKVGLAK